MARRAEGWTARLDQRAGKGNAHLHAAGQRARQRRLEAAKPDRVDEILHRRISASVRRREIERQSDIGLNARPRHQRRLLKDKADLAGFGAAPWPRGPARRSTRRAAGGRIEPGDEAQGASILPQPEGPERGAIILAARASQRPLSPARGQALATAPGKGALATRLTRQRRASISER